VTPEEHQMLVFVYNVVVGALWIGGGLVAGYVLSAFVPLAFVLRDDWAAWRRRRAATAPEREFRRTLRSWGQR
jgi:hypothetical protein